MGLKQWLVYPRYFYGVYLLDTRHISSLSYADIYILFKVACDIVVLKISTY